MTAQVRVLFALIMFVLKNIVLAQNLASYENNEIIEKPNSWFKTAQNMISSPAGNVFAHVAKELLNRSNGHTEVLSLNVTNLLVIILLKMLIFAAGLIGAGHWGHYNTYGYARSIDRSDVGLGLGLAEGEDTLVTGFLAAQGSGKNDCLYAAACSNPTLAYEYARAGKALIEAVQKFDENLVASEHYNKLTALLEKGAYDGYRGLDCNATTICETLMR